MKKLTLIDKMTGLEYEFPGWLRKTRVGREQKYNELVIPGREFLDSLGELEKEEFYKKAMRISRNSHLLIYQENGKIRVASPSETNIVYVSGEIIPKNIKLDVENGTKLTLGDSYNLEIRILEED